jgi:hypothetical protein
VEHLYSIPFATEQPFEKGTVEHHLLARARMTHDFTRSADWQQGFMTGQTHIMVDKTSIVDGKRLAVYSPFGEENIEALAIVPVGARIGDFLIDLRGGRVPLVIRSNEINSPEYSDPTVDFGIRQCRLIGEAVVNRPTVVSSMWRERVFVIK